EVQDVQVLLRLGHHPVVGSHGEEHEVHAMCAGEHVADEPLVPGHVDDARAHAFRPVEVGEAEIDRDAALLLLLQTVGVLPGERADERRLAVVDVPRRPDDEGHLQPSSTASSWASKTARRSRRKRPSWTRPITGGRAARKRAAMRSAGTSGWSIASARLGSGTTGTAQLPTSPCAVTTSTTYPAPGCAATSGTGAGTTTSNAAMERVRTTHV